MTPLGSRSVAIVGAGAAGLATAIFARGLAPALNVALLEGARKPGAKILVSGGGRCNVTNARVSERDYCGGRGTIIRQVLKGLSVEDTVAFFARIGVPLHEEANGKLFPDSNRARDVLEALVREAGRVGVALHADCRVTAVERRPEGFAISTNQGAIAAGRVVLATGGRSLPKSGSDGAGYAFAERLGHTIVPQTPALAPLLLEDRPDALHRRLSGVSHDAELSIWIGGRVSRRITGALLWTHFGISGPVALDASRHWASSSSARLTLNFCPGSTFDDVDHRLVTLIGERPQASIDSLLASFLPASVASALLDDTGLPRMTAGRLSRADRRTLAHALVERPLRVTDTRGYTVAEATSGGVALNEIDPTTMESRVCPGLYLVGEVLDVDGRLGGFNFQWAWSSARVAARALTDKA